MPTFWNEQATCLHVVSAPRKTIKQVPRCEEYWLNLAARAELQVGVSCLRAPFKEPPFLLFGGSRRFDTCDSVWAIVNRHLYLGLGGMVVYLVVRILTDHCRGSILGEPRPYRLRKAYLNVTLSCLLWGPLLLPPPSPNKSLR